MYELPNLKKKKETGNFYRRTSVLAVCFGLPSSVVSSCCCRSLCLVSMFPVPAAVQRGGQQRLCRTGMQPRQYRAWVCCLVLISHLQEESCSQCVKVHLIAVTFFFPRKMLSKSTCFVVSRTSFLLLFSVWSSGDGLGSQKSCLI